MTISYCEYPRKYFVTSFLWELGTNSSIKEQWLAINSITEAIYYQIFNRSFSYQLVTKENACNAVVRRKYLVCNMSSTHRKTLITCPYVAVFILNTKCIYLKIHRIWKDVCLSVRNYKNQLLTPYVKHCASFVTYYLRSIKTYPFATVNLSKLIHTTFSMAWHITIYYLYESNYSDQWFSNSLLSDSFQSLHEPTYYISLRDCICSIKQCTLENLLQRQNRDNQSSKIVGGKYLLKRIYVGISASGLLFLEANQNVLVIIML